MKILALSAILFAMPALATGEDQTLDFSVSVAGRDLGLYLVAGPTDCPRHAVPDPWVRNSGGVRAAFVRRKRGLADWQ